MQEDVCADTKCSSLFQSWLKRIRCWFVRVFVKRTERLLHVVVVVMVVLVKWSVGLMVRCHSPAEEEGIMIVAVEEDGVAE